MAKVLCYNCFHEVDDGVKFCTNCGKSMIEDRSKHPQALPWGTVLGGRYITGRVLGQGGFGITYAAQDYKTKEKVAVKEFFPDTMAMRGATGAAVPYSGQRGDDFTYGKATFLEEAKTLAEFNDVDGVVHVYSYFEENDTAYFAMEFVDGMSFQKYIENAGGRIPFDDAKRILLPVMDAMAKVHSRGIIHRDIKPDNIYVKEDGQVRILDFGSARYSMGEKSRSLDVVLTHGFAPREQYSRHGRQGAYTDVYALGATFYYAITGRKPQDSIDRMDEDMLAYPSALGARITPEEEDALMKALAVEPQDRYQNMLQFKNALLGLPQQEPGYGAQTAYGAAAYGAASYGAQTGTSRQAGYGQQTGAGYGPQPGRSGAGTGYGPQQGTGSYGAQTGAGTSYGAQTGAAQAASGTAYGTQSGGYGYGQQQGVSYGQQPGRSGAGTPQGTGYGTQPSPGGTYGYNQTAPAGGTGSAATQGTGTSYGAQTGKAGYGYGQQTSGVPYGQQPGRSGAGTPQGTGYGTQPAAIPQGGTVPASPAQGGTAPAAIPQGGTAPAVGPQGSTAPAVVPQGGTSPAAVPQGGTVPAVAGQGSGTGLSGTGDGNEKPKWLIPVLAACVVLLIAIIAIAASSAKKKKEDTASSTSPAISVTQTPTPVPESEEESSTVSIITGSIGTTPEDGTGSFGDGSGVSVLGYYPIYAMKYGDSSFGASALAEQGMTGDNTYMYFGTPTSGVVALVDGEEAVFTMAGGQVTVEGESVPYSVSGTDVSIFVTTSEGQTFEYIFRHTDETPPDGVGSTLPASGASSADGAVSGACGASATWRFDEAEETLYIEGTGAIYDYSYIEDIPWYSLNEKIEKVEIADGITHIGSGAFYQCQMYSLTMPESITSIGDYAFSGCPYLFSHDIPTSCTKIGKGVYQGSGLDSVFIYSDTLEIGDEAFADCSDMGVIYFYGNITSIGTDAFYNCNAFVFYPEGGLPAVAGDYGGKTYWIQNDFTYFVEYGGDFYFLRPTDWEIEFDKDWSSDTISIFHKASKEAGAGGHLVSMRVFDSKGEYQNLPSYQYLGELKNSDGDVRYLVAVFPTDVQFTTATQADYQAIFSNIGLAFQYIVGNYGYVFFPAG